MKTESALVAETLGALKENAVAARTAFEQAEAEIFVHREQLAAEIQRLQTEFSERHADAISAIEEKRLFAETCEATLREAIVDFYNRYREKQLGSGLSVRVTKKIRYEETQAIEWARANAPVCIVEAIDKKRFEALADGLDFVETIETVVPVISWK